MSTRPFASRWLDWQPGEEFRADAPRQRTDRTDRRGGVGVYVSSGSSAGGRIRPEFPADSDDVVAVLIRSAVLGELVWLVADDDVLADSPDIAASGLPVFTFAEVPQLQQLDAEGLRAVAAVKRMFPTGRLLQ